jgi:hypothetical protein
LRRSVAHTDCDSYGNARGKCDAYSYSDCNRFAYRDGNTDAHTYSHSKGYPDAQTSADSAPALVGRNLKR